jgi:hypothetical protein
MKKKEPQKLEHFVVVLVWQDGDNLGVVFISTNSSGLIDKEISNSSRQAVYLAHQL